MDSKQHDSITFYKEIERECNEIIHAHTNCRSFTRAFGRELNSHLDRLEMYKEVINKCLHCLDIPTKDEISAIANQTINCEEKLDIIDDTIYLMHKGLIKNKNELEKLKLSLINLREFLENERQEIKKNKVITLKKELEELKILFK